MKKIIYFVTLIIFAFACNSDVSVKVTDDNVSKIFAIVVFPAPEIPVNQSTKGFCFFIKALSFLIVLICCCGILALLFNASI